jgi:hypothetical protein
MIELAGFVFGQTAAMAGTDLNVAPREDLRYAFRA